MSDVDHVVPLDIGCVPEAAVSGATLLGDEYLTYLLFNAMCARPNGTREAAGLAVVKFDSCSVTKFGYPNDEALPGHPLYANGLSYYGVYEVLRSRWVAEKTRQNRVSFPPTPDDMTRRHFIFT